MKPAAALRNVKKAMTTMTWKNVGVAAVCVVLLPLWLLIAANLLWMATYFLAAALLLPIYFLAGLLLVAIITAPWWGLSLIVSWIAQRIRRPRSRS